MKKENSIKEGWTDKAAEKIAKTGIRVQTGFANKMGGLTRHLSSHKLKVLLIIFCITIGGYSIFLLGEALFSPEPDHTIKVQYLTVPKHVDKTGDEDLLSDQYVDELTYRQVIAYKKYMDSLKVVKHPLYDSLIRVRPGLMDTVQLLIEAYEMYKK